MKTVMFIAILLSGLSQSDLRMTKTSHNLKLELITPSEFQVKIDGGCSFYTYDTIPLKTEKYVLVVDALSNCFVKINNKIVYFSSKGRSFNKNGYVQRFSSGDYSLTLDVIKGDRVDTYYQFMGTLRISGKGDEGLMQIHGVNQEYAINRK
jgi:hypothetical protein